MIKRLAAVPALAQRFPALAAIVLGLIAACAYPPLHLWPLGLAGLAGFVWLTYTAETWRGALWRGWVFGWAHLTLANNWIATAFTHQAKMPEVLGWAAVPLLCIYLAWYPAFAALVAHLLTKKRPLWAFGLVLAGAWIITEWLRGWVFTGYPWPPLGLMLLALMAAAGVPGQAGFVAELLVFEGSWVAYPIPTLVCLLSSGFTAVYAVRLFNRVGFGRLDNTRADWAGGGWVGRWRGQCGGR